MDRKWWSEYGAAIDAAMELWTSSREAAKVYGLNFIPTEPGGGMSRKPGHIRQGGSSGFLAVSLALHFGASRVVLLGYDMRATGGRLHWHVDHGPKLGNPVPGRMTRWIEWFSELAKDAPGKVVNATQQTALRCFPTANLETALNEGMAQSAARRPRAA